MLLIRIALHSATAPRRFASTDFITDKIGEHRALTDRHVGSTDAREMACGQQRAGRA